MLATTYLSQPSPVQTRMLRQKESQIAYSSAAWMLLQDYQSSMTLSPPLTWFTTPSIPANSYEQSVRHFVQMADTSAWKSTVLTNQKRTWGRAAASSTASASSIA